MSVTEQGNSDTANGDSRHDIRVSVETEVGSMRGSYQMIGEDGIHFDAQIPAFTLAVPHALH